MYYRVPHRFRVIFRLGRAVMQYMLFSPPKSIPEEPLWLPKEPLKLLDYNRLNGEQAIRDAFQAAPKLTEFPVSEFSTFNAEDDILEILDINHGSKNMISNTKRMKQQAAYISMKSKILDIEESIVYDINRNMELQADGENCVKDPEEQKEKRLREMRTDGKVFRFTCI